MLNKLPLSKQFEIKLIQAGSKVKGLVLDMTKDSDRLLYISEGDNAKEAWNEANEYLQAIEKGGYVWN